MRKTTLAIAAAVIIVLAVFLVWQFWTPAENSSEAQKIVFGYRPISPSLDFFVALEKGYFQEEGLDVQLEVFRGSSDLTDAVMSGKVDFASDLGMVTQLLPMMRSTEYMVKFLSLDLDALDSPMRGPTIVVKSEAGIQKMEDLKGKTIGIFPGINFKIFLEAALKKHGIDVNKEVTIIQMAPQEQIAGFASVDAMLSLDPIVSGIEGKYGAKVIANRLSARYIFDNFPAAASSVNAEYAQKNPEVVAKVVRALSQGIDFVRTNPDQTIDILGKHTNLPIEIAKTMEPVKYARLEEIAGQDLQRVCDYLRSVEWLNLEGTLDAAKLVWREN